VVRATISLTNRLAGKLLFSFAGNPSMILDRRHLLRVGGAAAITAGMASHAQAQAPWDSDPQGTPPQPSGAVPDAVPDHTIRIGTGLLELGSDTIISTTLYNGQFPGPSLRFTEGKRVVIDIHNDTDTPEQLHWHGQFVPADVDGAAEEGTPFIPAHGMRRIAFTPSPAGFRFYHSHLTAGADLSLGLYSGQIGLVYIEPRQEPGAYDREVFLTLKEFGPYLSRTEMALDFLSPTATVPELEASQKAAMLTALKAGRQQGYEPAYNFFTINGRMLGQGEPVRVKPGERVLFHVLNASASKIRSLALPGHLFQVVALDGNLVPHPTAVPVLWLGPAERISTIVEMKHPGVWVLGETLDEDRKRGMGIVVEYAGANGEAQWQKPEPFRWDYRRFAKSDAAAAPPDETIALTIAAHIGARDGFDEFTINGTPFSMKAMQPRFRLDHGKRYRLLLRNATDDMHPIHLHRHRFEITSIVGMSTAGVIKDVVLLGGSQEMTVDFTTDQPGLSLFHCHMQNHMDSGFMALFDCV
jgi:FtsP/CotA-like multicopper oxidase with cupredoxin domain